MMLHKQHGDYNTETSIYVGLINPRCGEEDIIDELNLVLRDDRVKREKEQSLTRSNAKSQNQTNPEAGAKES